MGADIKEHLQEAGNGMFIRMALLEWTFEGD